MGRPLRVGFIAGEYPPEEGGLGDYTRELGRALIALDHDVRVVTLREVTTDHAPRNMQYVPRTTDLIPLRVVDRWNWRAWARVRDALVGIDIVHLQYQTAAYAMHPVANALPWLARHLGLPDASRPLIVTTYHDTRIPYLFPKAGRVRDWATDAPARASHLTIATNVEDGARLARVARRLTLIPIGSNIAPTADPQRRDVYRTRWGISPPTPLLVYFGFVNRAKGADTLVRALAQLRGGGLPAHLLMLGGQVGASDPTNRAFLAEVKALADDLGVTDAMTWTGFLPEAEVSEALTAADMATLPYREGVSLQRGTLMAALAHGLPVVTTWPPDRAAVGPLPTLRDGVNAACVPPDDPPALAETIRALWADPPRRARLGEGARLLAREFSWERIARQHVAAYEAAAISR